jgi:Holliday junction resolvase-like predicted endonuclease
MREALIQAQIKKYLEANGWLTIKLIQTTMNGIPDLIALKDGRTVFIEVKQPGKKPTDLQAYRHDKLRAKGFDVITATSLREASNFFAQYV